MDDLEILARELWIICNGDGGDPAYWRQEWKSMAGAKDFWLDEARKLRLALAEEGLFVMRSRDA